MDLKKQRIKVYQIDRVKDFVDVWRLFRSSINHKPWKYPSLGMTMEDAVKQHVVQYTLQNPNFFGMIVRKGRRPIGQIIGDVNVRPIGDPGAFFFIYNFFVEPEFRKKGVMKLLWKEVMDELRKRGIFNWEASCDEELKNFLLSYESYKTNLLAYRVGGKI